MLILIAKYSPDNNCMAPDGELLFPGIDHTKLAFGVQVPFIGLRSGLPSAFGWVAEASPKFSESDFEVAACDSSLDPEAMRNVLRLMLSTAAKHPIDTPMAAHYVARGIPPAPALNIHKVIFFGKTSKDEAD